MKSRKIYQIKTLKQPIAKPKRTVRKHLNADTLIKNMRNDFQAIPDHRASNSKISLDDALMSAFAMFQFKDPSLLVFDQRRQEEPENLHSIYGITNIPSDSQMRDILDPLEISSLRAPFKSAFRQLQRGKDFEKMTFLDGHYLLSGDGTGFYSSGKVSSPYCMGKKSKSGKITYYQQMYAASFVHPDHKEVVPVFPEMITKKDGTTKNDCERNAAGRFYEAFRREHPHLKVIVVEDGLSSNGPHIHDLTRLNLHFILGAKPGDHTFLFNQVDQAVDLHQTSEFSDIDPGNNDITHYYRFVNNVPLNASNQNLFVNFIEYWEENSKTGKVKKFSWVTDLPITKDNAADIVRAGRSRWKIENETFNTLKNSGYNLGHNYGLGKKNLSAIFTILMMLTFLIDQIQQMSCWLFQEAWHKAKSKRHLWECMRGFFNNFRVDSMETIYRAIAFGFERRELRNEYKT